MNAILALPTPLLMLAIFGFVLLCLMVGLATLFMLTRHGAQPATAMPVPPFIGVIAAAWALALGFAAADIWTLGGQADRAASAERSSIARLAGASAPEALDLPDMSEAIRRYAEAVARTEWGENLNHAPHPEVDAALQDIRIDLIAAAASNVPDAIGGKLVQDFDELQDARNARLAIGQSLVDESKWYLVAVLTLMTMIAMVFVHLDRPRGAARALVIFAAVAVSSLWVLALHVHPYSQREFGVVIASVSEA
ncbi:hypothetical protein ACFSX5_15110 [Devosia albogilva]|uniref:DUF4239 domain-containing protein n=1 Tax=Devosia albogilva TaxID=429726 RepID=A0ABW5QN33_9HYPH